LARAIESRLAPILRDRGLLADGEDMSAGSAQANLHILLTDGGHAYVGASAPPWASRWTMGLPRLRMPGSAPSRSTLKLAEAIVTFLGEREPELLRPGMR